MASNKEKYTILDLHNLKSEKMVCLTLDLEQDYGDLLGEPSYEGLEYIPELRSFFKEKGIPLTCFVQGSLFETHPTYIETLSTLDVEFELHSYSHPGPEEMDTKLEIEKGKQAYRRFFGKDPMGYRAPLGVLNEKNYEILAANGFKFDSSIFPSLRPGTFNNLRKPTKPYLLNNLKLVEFPLTVFTPIIRVPIALSYIKLFGRPYLYLLKTFNLPNFIIFAFHLHDLFELDSASKIHLIAFSPLYRLIFSKIYQKQRSDGLIILDEFITILHQRGYMFSRLGSIYESIIEVK